MANRAAARLTSCGWSSRLFECDLAKQIGSMTPGAVARFEIYLELRRKSGV